MGGPAMNGSNVDFEDVQGLVCFGYGRMTSASYALVRVKDRAAARAWFGSIPVSNAVDKPREEQPNTALQVAFTAPGLRVLGVPESVIEGFSHEFRAGMVQESRSRQLGLGMESASRRSIGNSNGRHRAINLTTPTWLLSVSFCSAIAMSTGSLPNVRC